MIVPRRWQLILVVALTITVIWILSAEKIIPEIWSIILSASVTVSGTVVAILPLIFPPSDGPEHADISSQIRPELRVALLERVKQVWITDFLQENSVYYPGGILPLELHRQEGRLEELLLKNSSSAADPPCPEKITEIYEKAHDGLLILGGAGSGKTTLLLELAQDLLRKAEDDPELPIPVVLSLSSWASQSQPPRLDKKWLAEALRATYQLLPTQMWEMLLDKTKLLLLFDGLDEVAPEKQSDCIKAIQTFYLDSQLAHVVCSQTEVYLKHLKQGRGLLTPRIAVTILPLAEEQIKKCLSFAEAESRLKVDGLRTVLQPHVLKRLRKIIEVPLVLNMLMCTSDGLPAETILPGIDKLSNDHYDDLFKNYVQRTLDRSGKLGWFDEGHARHWLTWLAQQLTRDVFYLEKLQFKWLPKKSDWPLKGALFSLFSSSLYWLLSLLLQLSNGIITTSEVPNWKWKEIPRAFRYQWKEISKAFRYLLWKELPHNDPWYFLANVGPQDEPWYSFVKEHRLHYDPWLSLTIAGLGPTVMGVMTGLIIGYFQGLLSGLLSGLILTAIWFLLSQVAMGMLLGGEKAFSFDPFKDDARLHPNQGIWRSGRHGLLAGLLLGPLGGLLFGLGGALIFGLLIGLSTGPLYITKEGRGIVTPPLERLALGLAAGIFLGLLAGFVCFFFIGLRKYGGLAWLQHMLLRLLLWSTNCTPRPWRYVAFLDEAVERRLLRKLGGGYVFRHRKLQDYFASLEPSPPASPHQSPAAREDSAMS